MTRSESLAGTEEPVLVLESVSPGYARVSTTDQLLEA